MPSTVRLTKFFCVFLMGCAGVSMTLAAQMRARDLEAPDIWLRIQATFGIFMYVVGNFFIGHVMKAARRRLLLLVGPLACLACAGLILIISDYRLLPLAVGLQGFGASFFWAPMEVTIAEEARPSRLSRSVGAFNISWTGGMMLGPPICGWLYDLDWKAPFAPIGAFYVLLIILLVTTRFAPRRAESDRADPHSAPAVAPHIARAHRLLAWIAIFAQGFFSWSLFSHFPKVTKGLGFPDSVPGMLLGLRGLALFVAFVFLSFSTRWRYRARLLGLIQLAGAVAVLIVAFYPACIPAMLIAFPVTGLVYAFCYNASIFYSISDSSGREVHSARHELLVGAGPVFGPLVVGAIAEIMGDYTLSFSVCALVIVAAVVVQKIVMHHIGKNGPRQAQTT